MKRFVSGNGIYSHSSGMIGNVQELTLKLLPCYK